MPMPEPDVRTTRVADVVRIQEEPQLRLGREPSTLGCRVRQQAVVRRQHRPMLRNVHRHLAIQRPDLSRLHEHARTDPTRVVNPP